MANLLKGEVPLVLKDKRAFTLVFDMDALIEAEGAYGKPMHALAADASAGFLGALRAMLYGAMRARHPQVTIADVSQILREDTHSVTLALTNALDQSMPEPGKAGAEGNAPAVPQRGKTSGGSGAKRSSTRKRSGG